MIKKVLVANRGEIAVRVMRSLREMNIRSVAIFSDADRTSFHVRYADEAYHIGPSPSASSYLNIDKIIEVAKACQAEAIHPGYGFLSENARFSERCQREGIIFIGPSPFSIATMGDKITARKTMIAANVPVVPGSQEKITDDNHALEIIRQIGLPVMIKASAGGGGKGMRLVRKESDILSSIRGAVVGQSMAFGDDAVYIEKYIDSPHHIEYQILADTHGNAVHLFERECSVQRRHQKVIEETPSPLLTTAIREEMGKYAVAAAKAVGYYGAGTIEFIVDDNLNYYFLEMNTRLQVEHPVTEMVVGVDLVKEQVRIAAGEVLHLKQEELTQNGHAIECRIYAEDTDNNFMPNPGVVKHITQPSGNGVRVDGYVYEGFEIPLYYDPMISKLIVWAHNREDAIERMRRALHEYKITGVKTSIKFLDRIMQAPDFRCGKYNTHFIENNFKFLMQDNSGDEVMEDLAMIIAYIDHKAVANGSALMHSNNNQCNLWKNHGRRKAFTEY